MERTIFPLTVFSLASRQYPKRGNLKLEIKAFVSHGHSYLETIISRVFPLFPLLSHALCYDKHITAYWKPRFIEVENTAWIVYYMFVKKWFDAWKMRSNCSGGHFFYTWESEDTRNRKVRLLWRSIKVLTHSVPERLLGNFIAIRRSVWNGFSNVLTQFHALLRYKGTSLFWNYIKAISINGSVSDRKRCILPRAWLT